MHHHGDELHAIPLRRGGQAVQGRVGKPGFQPRGPLVVKDQPVGVGQLEGAVPQGVHPDGGVFPDGGMVQNQLPAHPGDVVGTGQVARGGQPGAVDKGGVIHAQLPGPLVHPLHKGVLAARDVLGQGHGAVVGGHHCHRLYHVSDGHLLVFLQPDLAAPHGNGVGGGGDHIIPAQAARVDGLHHQQQGHHLCH